MIAVVSHATQIVSNSINKQSNHFLVPCKHTVGFDYVVIDREQLVTNQSQKGYRPAGAADGSGAAACLLFCHVTVLHRRDREIQLKAQNVSTLCLLTNVQLKLITLSAIFHFLFKQIFDRARRRRSIEGLCCVLRKIILFVSWWPSILSLLFANRDKQVSYQ